MPKIYKKPIIDFSKSKQAPVEIRKDAESRDLYSFFALSLSLNIYLFYFYFSLPSFVGTLFLCFVSFASSLAENLRKYILCYILFFFFLFFFSLFKSLPLLFIFWARKKETYSACGGQGTERNIYKLTVLIVFDISLRAARVAHPAPMKFRVRLASRSGRGHRATESTPRNLQ